RSAEAPASTDAANLKLQGQSLALTPVASSGWLAHFFMSNHFFLLFSLNSSITPRTSEPTELALVMSELAIGEKTPLVQANASSTTPSFVPITADFTLLEASNSKLNE